MVTPDWDTHDIKVWPEFFEALALGLKTWEVRLNDRGYKMGDLLVLREWDPKDGEMTGRALQARVSYVAYNPPGCEAGVVIMSLTEVKKW